MDPVESSIEYNNIASSNNSTNINSSLLSPNSNIDPNDTNPQTEQQQPTLVTIHQRQRSHRLRNVLIFIIFLGSIIFSLLFISFFSTGREFFWKHKRLWHILNRLLAMFGPFHLGPLRVDVPDEWTEKIISE